MPPLEHRNVCLDVYYHARNVLQDVNPERCLEVTRTLIRDPKIPVATRLKSLVLAAYVCDDWDESEDLRLQAEADWYVVRTLYPQGEADLFVESTLAESREELDELAVDQKARRYPPDDDDDDETGSESYGTGPSMTEDVETSDEELSKGDEAAVATPDKHMRGRTPARTGLEENGSVGSEECSMDGDVTPTQRHVLVHRPKENLGLQD